MTSERPVQPRFGTDGIRGEAGKPPLDTPTLRRVGAALGILLQRSGPDHKRVVVGHDGRASANQIRDALAQGLAAADAAVTDLGLVTTPALALVTRTEPFVAGIMISASHNPAHDNGIKIFAADGTKLPDTDEREIERLCLDVEPDDPDRPARIHERRELTDRYVEFLGNTFCQLDLAGHKIVVDAAHGGGAELAPTVLRAFGAEVVAVACAPDGTNINDGVGALHAANLAEIVRREGAMLGICLDGDGDRCIFIDDTGEVRDGDAVMAALARHMNATGDLAGATVVATVMSNLGLRKVLAASSITIHTMPVGDRSVVAAMREHDFDLGGEQSGHIIFSGDGHHTGDGLFTALKLLSLPAMRSGRSASVFEGFRRFPQVLLNIPVSHKPDLTEIRPVQDAVAEVERVLGDDGRVLLRYSGTENLCRVMVEGPTEGTVRDHAEAIADAVRQAL